VELSQSIPRISGRAGIPGLSYSWPNRKFSWQEIAFGDQEFQIGISVFRLCLVLCINPDSSSLRSGSAGFSSIISNTGAAVASVASSGLFAEEWVMAVLFHIAHDHEANDNG
jgi:hypothetical protein